MRLKFVWVRDWRTWWLDHLASMIKIVIAFLSELLQVLQLLASKRVLNRSWCLIILIDWLYLPILSLAITGRTQPFNSHVLSFLIKASGSLLNLDHPALIKLKRLVKLFLELLSEFGALSILIKEISEHARTLFLCWNDHLASLHLYFQIVCWLPWCDVARMVLGTNGWIRCLRIAIVWIPLLWGNQVFELAWCLIETR